MTPEMIIKAIRETTHALEQAQQELARCTLDEANAKHEYKVAWAKSYLRHEGPVKQREALADMDTALELASHAVKEALCRSAREAWMTKRDNLSALQTVASTIREEARLAR